MLPAFEEAVSALGGRLCRPLLSPVEGAVLLAARTFSPESYETARQTLLEKRG